MLLLLPSALYMAPSSRGLSRIVTGGVTPSVSFADTSLKEDTPSVSFADTSLKEGSFVSLYGSLFEGAVAFGDWGSLFYFFVQLIIFLSSLPTVSTCCSCSIFLLALKNGLFA